MEASFAMDSNKEMKAFKGLVGKERMKGLLKIKTGAMIEVVFGVVGTQFQEREVN